MGLSVLEKEAFDLLATVKRLHWLTSTPAGFDLFTDHNNLIFIFELFAVQPDLALSAQRKELRWVVRLTSYNYTCVHIIGHDKVWADFIGRWLAPPIIRRLFTIPTFPSASSVNFSCPRESEIRDIQLTEVDNRTRHLIRQEGVYRFPSG